MEASRYSRFSVFYALGAVFLGLSVWIISDSSENRSKSAVFGSRFAEAWPPERLERIARSEAEFAELQEIWRQCGSGAGLPDPMRDACRMIDKAYPKIRVLVLQYRLERLESPNGARL